MKKIESFDNAIANKAKDIKALCINPTAFWAYRESIKADNDLINFYDVIWDNDIEEIATTLNENGITEFTISSNFSGLIKTLAEFEKHGFKVAGITEVNATYTDFNTGEPVRVPALRMMKI